MQKLVVVLQFRKDMSREEALRYWREVHGPIASKTPGLRKYVQDHATAAPEGGLQFDGIAELWFDSQEALQSAMASREWQATIADVPNFAVLEKSWAALVDEISVV
ncbi:hypothetical protein LCGC14_2736470 [marine sediment metagenome]|uniref:EthD domain-containing protein n=1 Tax=marine sediment metagenome TaxID=412755 RepID=A0A0F8Z5S5_9ZZZZ